VPRGRLACPPAKMLQRFTQFIRNFILSRLSILQMLESKPNLSSMVGLTWEVAFKPMEGKAMTHVAAAQADDAEVDLSAWALPGETLKEARTRDVLLRLAIQWWASNLSRKAMRWWTSNGKDPKDLAAIQNCIFQAHACSYWHWHCGSHLFFWRFSKEFQVQMRDGIPFYHLCPAPRGHAHNTPPH
jgi:hypothetical protein